MIAVPGCPKWPGPQISRPRGPDIMTASDVMDLVERGAAAPKTD